MFYFHANFVAIGWAGRMGNNMFQYASAYGIAKRLGAQLCLKRENESADGKLPPEMLLAFKGPFVKPCPPGSQPRAGRLAVPGLSLLWLTGCGDDVRRRKLPQHQRNRPSHGRPQVLRSSQEKRGLEGKYCRWQLPSVIQVFPSPTARHSANLHIQGQRPSSSQKVV